jgi:hypothetical protein
MKPGTRILLCLTAVGLALAVLACNLHAQTRRSILDDDKKNDLIRRMRSSGTRMEDLDEFDLRAPEEKESADDKKEDKKDLTGTGQPGEGFTADPNELRRRMSTTRRPMTYRELLEQYDRGTSTEDLLKRIREGRPGSEEGKKEGEESEEEPLTRPGLGGGGVKVETPKYGVEDRFHESLRGRPGIVGSRRLTADDEYTVRIGGEATRQGTLSSLPDPGEDLQAYRRRLSGTVYQSGRDERYLDNVVPDLRSTVEGERLNREVINRYEARIIPQEVGNLGQAFKAYESLTQLPRLSDSLGRRDVYVPNSTNYLNQTYRGSIYGIPYSNDPYQRNWAPQLTRSKYSTESYYNFNVQESFADWYQREYGVSNAFVPGSTARQYDINTLQQWQSSLRRDYGIDVRATQSTYADMYRLHTGKYSGP